MLSINQRISKRLSKVISFICLSLVFYGLPLTSPLSGAITETTTEIIQEGGVFVPVVDATAPLEPVSELVESEPETMDAFLPDTGAITAISEESQAVEGHGTEVEGSAAEEEHSEEETTPEGAPSHLESGATQDYVVEGYSWTNFGYADYQQPVTARIDQSVFDILTNGTQAIIDTVTQALWTWDSVIPLSLQLISSGTAEIMIRALSASDFYARFGSSNYIAYAYYPSPGDGGDVFLNGGYVSAFGYLLLETLLHEFGHSLGLTHSGDSRDVMYSYISDEKTQLTTNDILNMQHQYPELAGPPPQGRPPVISTDFTSYTVVNSQTLSFTIRVNDPDGDQITLAVSGKMPKGATLTNNGNGTWTFTWTPNVKFPRNATSKDFSVTFTATDSTGQSTSITIRITVLKTAPGGGSMVGKFLTSPSPFYAVPWMGVASYVTREVGDPKKKNSGTAGGKRVKVRKP